MKKQEEILREYLHLGDLSSASEEELQGLLVDIERRRNESFKKFQQAETIIRRTLRQKRRERGVETKNIQPPPELREVGLPVLPVVIDNEIPVGDVNLLMNDVSLIAPPFDQIIMNLAKDFIRRTRGLLPTIEVQSVREGEHGEKSRIIVRWELNRTISSEELSGICQVCRWAYEREIKGFSSRGWDAVNYRDIHGKVVPAKYCIYFGPQNYFSSSATGVIVSRKFPTAAEAKFLIQTRPREWLASSASSMRSIITEVEIREGPADENRAGLAQDNFLELVVQIAFLLANQKLIERRVLMTSIFREMNRVGTVNIDREKLFGMRSVLEVIERVLLLALQQPDLSRALDFRSESVLLAGVPGVGKTFLSHFLMGGDYNAIFASIDSNRLYQDLKRSGEKGVTPMLLKIDRIRELTSLPVIPLVDDIDVALQDSDVVSKFLNLLQGIREKGLQLIASTNHPEKVDERLLEPGRLSKIIHVPLPNLEDRKGVLRVHIKGRPFESEDERERIINQMAEKTTGWTQRYLWELCVEAARLCGLEIVGGNITKNTKIDVQPLMMSHFEGAFNDLMKWINLKRIQKRDKEISSFVSQRSKVPGFR